MKNFFESSDRRELLDRLDRLRPDAARQWGKMEPAQMLAHCAAALEVAAGDVPKRQAFIGKVLAPFVKKKIVGGPEPLSKNAPTDPTFVVNGPRDFEKERTRLVGIGMRFGEAGADAADGRMHSFFGRLSGDEWGVLMYKHLDHHLRQFGA
ncbi:MAG TPA: DUF1569 domain-containing protein [Thermoanaerobaculia bacterium]|nr:DUF1569 domain-containing protein [Thermoanaerobaculia bacterium]